MVINARDYLRHIYNKRIKMRIQDNRKNIEQANLMLENFYLKSKGLLKEEDGVKTVWNNAKKIFPNLLIEKKGNNGIVIIGNGGVELVTMTGNASYLESQLTIFLSGMIHGYNQKS